ncbi:hypothetical protein N9E03_00070 [bacterium]|jgi:hypothetical protein|nr:hypothetical protein [bacterium]
MRLSNLEEGSYNNTPEPKKMQVTVADKKANTEAWKRYQAGDSRYEFKNPTTEAEVEEGKSPHKKGTAKYKKHMAAMHAESSTIQVREAGSPWTTTGKHPEKMTVDELWGEIAVFDHIQDRGERLTPKDMMRLDSLFSYMDTAEMNEAIHRKADSMMESAVWKAKKNK